MGTHYSPRIVTDGLVLCLDAANPKSYPGTGTAIYNLKDNDSGTFVNGISYNSETSGYLSFDGADDYITMGNSYSVPTTITLLTWIYRNGTNGGMVFSNSTQYGLFAGGTYWHWDANPNWKYYGCPLELPSNEWVFYGVTHSPGGNTLPIFYINGIGYQSSGSVPTPSNAGGNGDLKIGEYSIYRPYSPFSGRISMSMIYNKVLSSTEIQQNFQATRGRYGI